MRKLLPLFSKPGRYLGNEWGAVHKDPDNISIHVALAFPDLYEVGMSYVGQKILYERINAEERFWAERVFAPSEDVAEILTENKAPLCSLESDTPLADMDVVAFSITHELCYTNVLYMLDLAEIPLKSKDRDDSHPLVMAGGGVCFNAEPMSEFLDLMILGDGEQSIIQVLTELEKLKSKNASRSKILDSLRKLPGCYVPSFFEQKDYNSPLVPVLDDYQTVDKAVVPDLDKEMFPVKQVIPFVKAVHDRLSIEIARGCTRGCRFCHAGMIYRPARERKPETVVDILEKGIASGGFEETSFLSLSTGDYSALEDLFSKSFERCQAEQVAISLPSLRVGSLSDRIMELISSIRRTGATLAPEAGSQRLRDVINKDITEDQLMDHVKKLFANGWQGVKLYFMIGLPTETTEDLDAILDLCLKVKALAGPTVKRLQITAAVSPFVPKPHTPFQWQAQDTMEQIKEKIDYLYDIFRRHKKVSLKHHEPEMSFLEGVFSRAGRELGPVVLSAYRKGAIFTSWRDKLSLPQWLEALEENGLDPAIFFQAKDLDAPMPWDHLNPGIDKDFLKRELKRALEQKISKDCRYNPCLACGVCDNSPTGSKIKNRDSEEEIIPRMIFSQRDSGADTEIEFEKPNMSEKARHYRIWYSKMGQAAFLSQLELQSQFERAFRRSKLPISFSAGFHPMPRMSFGRALSVGIESQKEWLNLFLREDMEPMDVLKALAGSMPGGIEFISVQELSIGKKQPQPNVEDYILTFTTDEEKADKYIADWLAFSKLGSFKIMRKSKKGMKETDIRPLVKSVEQAENQTVLITFDFGTIYYNPLLFVNSVCEGISPLEYHLLKSDQRFD